MIIYYYFVQDAGCLWLQNSGHGPPSGMMCRPSFVLYKTWGVCARILSGKQNRAASAAWSADCLYLISLSPHSPSGPSHAGSSALRWERDFYFSLYHMTEYFTNVMLLLHEYNFYVSFYRMTKYFTNIILLLNEYYLWSISLWRASWSTRSWWQCNSTVKVRSIHSSSPSQTISLPSSFSSKPPSSSSHWVLVAEALHARGATLCKREFFFFIWLYHWILH